MERIAGGHFGSIGSTFTSLICHSFIFIFFALEAAIMACALELAWDIPPAWGCLTCALVVIPLVTHGVTAISQLQMWTQPLWLVLPVLTCVVVFNVHPTLVGELRADAGENGAGSRFDPLLTGNLSRSVENTAVSSGQLAAVVTAAQPPDALRGRIAEFAAVDAGAMNRVRQRLPGLRNPYASAPNSASNSSANAAEGKAPASIRLRSLSARPVTMRSP